MANKQSEPKPTLSAIEISGADLKTEHRSLLDGAGATAFDLRDQPVMLASDVALIFGVETREIVQNIKSSRLLNFSSADIWLRI